MFDFNVMCYIVESYYFLKTHLRVKYFYPSLLLLRNSIFLSSELLLSYYCVMLCFCVICYLRKTHLSH